ncbi:MAG: transcription termination/antitermination NusG family protein [Chitinophagaceae bacterium]
MNTTQSWNAIYTRRNCEEKVCKMLERKGIVHYFAKNQDVAAASQRKLSFKPLFDSIIFVQVPAGISILSFKELPNVTNILYWQQAPAVFPAAEISLLRDFLEANLTVEATKVSLSAQSISNIHLQNLHSFSEDNIHTIHLPSIGYCLSAKAEPVTNIKLVRKDVPSLKTTNSLAFIPGFKRSTVKFE